jgi:hypothetical protein
MLASEVFIIFARQDHSSRSSRYTAKRTFCRAYKGLDTNTTVSHWQANCPCPSSKKRKENQKKTGKEIVEQRGLHRYIHPVLLNIQIEELIAD